MAPRPSRSAAAVSTAPAMLVLSVVLLLARATAAQQAAVPSPADCQARVDSIGQNNLLLR